MSGESQQPTDPSDSRISREEMVEMFGSEIPIEAVQLLWSPESDDLTLRDVRMKLRGMAEGRKLYADEIERLRARVAELERGEHDTEERGGG